MSTHIRITWEDIHHRDNFAPWNEICARTIEQFGMPGDRWMSSITVDHMDWIFKEEQDAVMFMLEHGGQIVSNKQTTVEFVGGLL